MSAPAPAMALHEGPARPAAEPPFLWLQTGLGPDGTGVALWLDDGTPEGSAPPP